MTRRSTRRPDDRAVDPVPPGPTLTTKIPGVLLVDLEVTDDARGWSKTNLDRTAGLPALPEAFVPTRWCANFNEQAGVTRGIHAEYTNKYVSIAQGVIWAAIVDLRAGPTFGNVLTVELTAGQGLFIPIGCGNSYQTQTPRVHYSYLADDNVGTDTDHLGVNLADPDLAIPWPIPLSKSLRLADDHTQPWLRDISPLTV